MKTEVRVVTARDMISITVQTNTIDTHKRMDDEPARWEKLLNAVKDAALVVLEESESR